LEGKIFSSDFLMTTVLFRFFCWGIIRSKIESKCVDLILIRLAKCWNKFFSSKFCIWLYCENGKYMIILWKWQVPYGGNMFTLCRRNFVRLYKRRDIMLWNYVNTTLWQRVFPMLRSDDESPTSALRRVFAPPPPSGSGGIIRSKIESKCVDLILIRLAKCWNNFFSSKFCIWLRFI
jgi:hypothetical protein